MIYPENFENKIGFDRIREMLKAACLSELGQKKIDELTFISEPELIHKLLERVGEFVKILDSDREFPVDHYHNLLPVIKKVRLEGTFIELDELIELKLSLDSIKAVVNYFKGEEGELFPHLKEIASVVKIYPFVTESINKIVTGKGKVKDNASHDLSKLRKSLREKSGRVGSRMQSILKKARENGLVDEGVELSMRDGRMVIPLRSADKRKISGLVHDESATGKTTFVEPAEIVELNNEIRELEYAEKREIIRILVEFTNSIRPYLEDLAASYYFLGEMDFIRAKAVFAKRIHALKPGLLEGPGILWDGAKHPLLFLNFKEQNKEVVPLDIILDKEKHILLISGPNAGGKSVCLQTVVLLQYMLQCGLLVPVKGSSRFGIFKKLFLDFGDEQSIENDLSTYSSHLLNMKFFLRNADPDTLVLIDEFGTGTEPLLGGAIAQAILGRLNEQGVYGVITTHYTNLKHFASSAEGIENGAMLFDHQKIQPLFKLQMGKPGSSFAFEIARSIGLPDPILKTATDNIGEDHIYFDKHLREIARDKRYWENKRSKIRKSEKRLDEVLNDYSEELELVKKEKKKILNEARKEAEDLLNGVNRKIEHTIRVIRETQAEKEKTRKAREELSELNKQLQTEHKEEDRKLERKIEELKRRKSNRKNRTGERISPKIKPEINEEKTSIEVGDKVKMMEQELAGEVLEVQGNKFLIAFGNMITLLPAEKIQRLGRSEFRDLKGGVNRPGNSYMEEVQKRKLRFNPHLDVRGKRAEEAIGIVQDFIDDAIVTDTKDLSILHGKGNGILRQLIREFLGSVDVVSSYHDEHPDRGGYGITLVKLDF